MKTGLADLQDSLILQREHPKLGLRLSRFWFLSPVPLDCSKDFFLSYYTTHINKPIIATSLFELLLGQKVRVFLEGKRQEGVLLPELGTEVSVGGSEGVEDGLDEVTHGTGVTTGARVAIGDTGHGHELLSGGRGNQSGTARSGN